MKISSSLAALILALVLSSGSQAGVTVAGDVTPDPLIDLVSVRVGDSAPGSLTIDEGSTLELSSLNIAGSSVGRVTVSGVGSSLTTRTRVNVGADMRTSSAGLGRLTIADGAQAQVGGAFQLSSLDQSAIVTVDGEGSVLAVDGLFRSGLPGVSLTRVANGGVAILRDGVIESGDIEVSGLGSFLSVFGFGDGAAYNGRLRIEDQAVVTDSGGVTQFGSQSRVELMNGTLSVQGLRNIGVIRGSGAIVLGGFNASINEGLIEAGVSDHLRFQPASGEILDQFENDGDVFIDGGRVDVLVDVLNGPNSESNNSITLRDGELRLRRSPPFTPSLVNQSLVAAIGGVSDLHGAVRNGPNGTIAVTNNSTLFFHDSVENSDGRISVSEGSRAIFLDDLDFQSGVLQAEIFTSDPTNNLGTIEVVGEANLNGAVSAALAGGFEPSLGDSFTLLTASGGITGMPTLGEVPELAPGLSWDLSIEANALVLDVIGGVPGDANGDALVNAADYAVLRDSGGLNTAADLAEWRSNYGTLIGVVGDVAAVPEPSSTLLLMAFAAATVWRRGI